MAFVSIPETGVRVPWRRPQWHPVAVQVRPDERGRDRVHVRRYQTAARRRGRLHQQRRLGSSRVAAERQNQRLEKHVGRESFKRSDLVFAWAS